MTKKLIKIEEINFTLNEEENENILKQKIIKILGIKEDEILSYKICKKAIDSRHKKSILIVYSVFVDIGDNESFFNKKHFTKILENIKRHKIRLVESFEYKISKIDQSKAKLRPIIVGSGPSGLFCSLILAKAGLKPIILERGSQVDKRIKDVKTFFDTGFLNINSNVQFGEGGAGTFSDGKLYTLVNDNRSKFIFEELVNAGAPSEIIYSARPHIGTDKLIEVVKNLRQKIISLGGEFMFDTTLVDIEIEDSKISNAILQNGEKLKTDDLILAIGHSSRDTYEMLYKKGLTMFQKPFAIGVRIEHKREIINKAQFGDYYDHKKLPTANYKLVSHNDETRSVYTFCMCPGGEVINASSENGKLCINGMSLYAQNSINSNSALLVNVLPSDFGSDHPLAGIEFQRYWEQKAFEVGGSDFSAPAQLVGDFLQDKPSTNFGQIQTTFKPKLKLTSLNKCLPGFVIDALKKALIEFDKKIPGFASNDAILIGIESRTSSVLRLFRDEKLESNIMGIYPTGEGAGYAGGITSSAIDGLIVGENIIKKYL